MKNTGSAGSAGSADSSELSARERLLDAVVEQIRGYGLANQSLRQLGEAVGSSHRMLIYHFGSRQGLADAVAARTLAERQLQVDRLRLERHPERSADGRQLTGIPNWADFVDDMDARGALLFELWVQAMTSSPGSQGFRAEASVSSITSLTAIWSTAGCSPELARDLAVLQLAFGRGLMLDLLLGGDQPALARSAAQFAAVFTRSEQAVHAMEQLASGIGERARSGAATGPSRTHPAGPSRSRPIGPARRADGSARRAVGSPVPGRVDGSATRQRLVDALMDHVGTTGLGGQSLRQLATALGTSHRMLIYYFGSRTGLVDEVVSRIEAQQRADLALLVEEDRTRDPNNPAFTGLWLRMLDRLDANGPLVFELALLAMQERDGARVRDLMIDSYLGPLTDFWVGLGFEAPAGADVARAHVAVARGLMIDYLLGGSRESTRRAIGLFGAMISGAVDSGTDG